MRYVCTLLLSEFCRATSMVASLLYRTILTLQNPKESLLFQPSALHEKKLCCFIFEDHLNSSVTCTWTSIEVGSEIQALAKILDLSFYSCVRPFWARMSTWKLNKLSWCFKELRTGHISELSLTRDKLCLKKDFLILDEFLL